MANPVVLKCCSNLWPEWSIFKPVRFLYQAQHHQSLSSDTPPPPLPHKNLSRNQQPLCAEACSSENESLHIARHHHASCCRMLGSAFYSLLVCRRWRWWCGEGGEHHSSNKLLLQSAPHMGTNTPLNQGLHILL